MYDKYKEFDLTLKPSEILSNFQFVLILIKLDKIR